MNYQLWLIIFEGRDDAKPIAICVAEVADLGVWGEVDEGVAASGVLGDLLPGPVTILLRRKERLNAEFNPATRLVGIRDTIECSREISVQHLIDLEIITLNSTQNNLACKKNTTFFQG